MVVGRPRVLLLEAHGGAEGEDDEDPEEAADGREEEDGRALSSAGL